MCWSDGRGVFGGEGRGACRGDGEVGGRGGRGVGVWDWVWGGFCAGWWVGVGAAASTLPSHEVVGMLRQRGPVEALKAAPLAVLRDGLVSVTSSVAAAGTRVSRILTHPRLSASRKSVCDLVCVCACVDAGLCRCRECKDS